MSAFTEERFVTHRFRCNLCAETVKPDECEAHLMSKHATMQGIGYAIALEFAKVPLFS